MGLGRLDIRQEEAAPGNVGSDWQRTEFRSVCLISLKVCFLCFPRKVDHFMFIGRILLCNNIMHNSSFAN